MLLVDVGRNVSRPPDREAGLADLGFAVIVQQVERDEAVAGRTARCLPTVRDAIQVRLRFVNEGAPGLGRTRGFEAVTIRHKAITGRVAKPTPRPLDQFIDVVFGKPCVDRTAMQAQPGGLLRRSDVDVRKLGLRKVSTVRIDEGSAIREDPPFEQECDRLAFPDVDAPNGPSPGEFDVDDERHGDPVVVPLQRFDVLVGEARSQQGDRVANLREKLGFVVFDQL